MRTPLARRAFLLATSLVLTATAGAAAAAAPPAPSPGATTDTSAAVPSAEDQAIITLRHGEELTLPPAERQKFSYTAKATYWSVVGMSEAASYDLSLWADPQNTVLLARSKAKTGPEFVVVDSNRAPTPRTYYPTVTGDNPDVTYSIEIDTNSTQLVSGVPLVVPMTGKDLIAVQDTHLLAGGKYKFTVSAEPDQNPALYLMRSIAGETRTWYQDRQQAVAKALSMPDGKPETFTYTAPATGWYGLVLTNNTRGAGSGVYTITRSGP